MRDAAADIHANRIAGLYVGNSDDGLNIPSQAISPRHSQAIIKYAEALVSLAESEQPREDIPQEEADLQIWFLKAFDEPEKRKRMFTANSTAKLKEANDVKQWTRSLKADIEAEDERLRLLAERELRRPPKSPDQNTKDKWKFSLRIETTSHSIRSVPLKQWNDGVNWIKLAPQQGAKKKEQLLIEITLRDDVPLAALWGLGFNLSLQFLIAINMATSGFWWWPPAPNQRRFYESITDLESRAGVELEAGGFRVFGGPRVALTDVHVRSLLICFTCLPQPYDQPRAQAYAYYLGGLNFLALNCIQWRCEAQAFGNFLASLKLLMVEASYVRQSETSLEAIGRYLQEQYPALDNPDAFMELVRKYEQTGSAPPPTKIDDVYLIKLLCEKVFRDTIIPNILRRKASNNGEGGTAAIGAGSQTTPSQVASVISADPSDPTA